MPYNPENPIERAQPRTRPVRITPAQCRKGFPNKPKTSITDAVRANLTYNHSVAAINSARRAARRAALQPRYGFLKPVNIVLGTPHRLAPGWYSEIRLLARAQWAELWSFYGFDWEMASVGECRSAYKKAYGWE